MANTPTHHIIGSPTPLIPPTVTEVAGPPDNAPNKHVIGDSKKTFRTDILNLIAILREHLDCDINLATRIKVFSTLSISKFY